MKKIIYFLGMVCFFSGITAFKAQPPAVVTDTHYESSGPFSFNNPCNNEVINYSGTISEDDHSVINGNKFNTQVHVSGHLTGTDGAGNTYEANLNIHQTNNGAFNDGGAGVFDIVQRIEFISKGNATNFVATVLIHSTSNANGTGTVAIVTISAECRG